MEFLPIFMNMRGRRTLVVGGGNVAARKAELVLAAGPAVTVVSPDCGRAMQALAARTDVTCHARPFASADVDDVALVIAATDDAEVNRAVYAAATARNLPVNIADQPELCSFILPAIVDRSPVVVAVSTGGRSPVLARFTKAFLERQLPVRLGELADLVGVWRERVKARLCGRDRRRFWDRIIDGPAGELALAGNREAAEQGIEQELADWRSGTARAGSAYLIGAGPGDPELITLRGQRLLQRADVVLYDRLVPSELLALCRREAELIYVGKAAQSHVVPQERIGELIVEHARAGRCVARLKGGDPFVFGRGGEELEALIEAGLSFEVVPGISAANGCAAYAGIPLTHRDHATGVSFWTGHMRDGGLDLPWAQMTMTHHTHVVFMGLKSLPLIAECLVAHGMDPAMPAAVVSAGTTRAQQVVTAPLAELADRVEAAGLPSPALLIVGSVVSLRDTVNWYRAPGIADRADGAADEHVAAVASPFPLHVLRPQEAPNSITVLRATSAADADRARLPARAAPA